jgi:hypothetical protein
MLLKSAGGNHCPGLGSSFIEMSETIRLRGGVQCASTFPLDASQPISEKDVQA